MSVEIVELAEGNVLCWHRDGAMVVQLNRVHKRNALDRAMIEAIHYCLSAAEEREIRVIELRGSPGFFSAGADIAGYKDARAQSASLEEFTNRARDLCTRLTTVDAVVVAVVDGVAMGGGCELVLAADIVIASDSSVFGLPEISLGLIPGWGGTQRLARMVGIQRAKEAIFTGIPIQASEAAERGMLTRVVPSDDLDEAAREFTSLLAQKAPLALIAAKSAIGASYDPERGASSGSREETARLLELFSTDDGMEGVLAFLEKRSPQFLAT